MRHQTMELHFHLSCSMVKTIPVVSRRMGSVWALATAASVLMPPGAPVTFLQAHSMALVRAHRPSHHSLQRTHRHRLQWGFSLAQVLAPARRVVQASPLHHPRTLPHLHYTVTPVSRRHRLRIRRPPQATLQRLRAIHRHRQITAQHHPSAGQPRHSTVLPHHNTVRRHRSTALQARNLGPATNSIRPRRQRHRNTVRRALQLVPILLLHLNMGHQPLPPTPPTRRRHHNGRRPRPNILHRE